MVFSEPVDLNELNDAIDHINTNSAPGEDRIQYFFQKYASKIQVTHCQVIQPLTRSFNHCKLLEKFIDHDDWQRDTGLIKLLANVDSLRHRLNKAFTPRFF